MKVRRARADLQEYRNRTYIGHLYDDRVFDLLNEGEDTTFLFAQGSIDALDWIPAGAMYRSGDYIEQRSCERGRTLAELEEEAREVEEIIAEILAEEKNR